MLTPSDIESLATALSSTLGDAWMWTLLALLIASARKIKWRRVFKKTRKGMSVFTYLFKKRCPPRTHRSDETNAGESHIKKAQELPFPTNSLSAFYPDSSRKLCSPLSNFFLTPATGSKISGLSPYGTANAGPLGRSKRRFH